MSYYYKLQVPADRRSHGSGAQYYFANNLLGLVWTILTHRLWHLFRGDGWQD